MPPERLQHSLRATAIGMVSNSLLAAIKLVAGIAGHSSALVADAIESFADVASSIVVWRAMVFAHRPPDESHPYGHGKAETLGAAAVSLILLAASVFIVVGAANDIAAPHDGPAPFTLWVLLLVIFIKVILGRLVGRIGEQVDSLIVTADAWHHWSDAITSAAAAIGISIYLIGGPGFEAADEWAAIVAAVVIAFNGLRLLRPAIDELMDAHPQTGVGTRAEQIALTVPGVQGIEKCLGRKMGYHYILDMHMEVDGTMSVADAHTLSHQVKDAIRAEIPRVSEVTIHIEPHGLPQRMEGETRGAP